MNDITYFYQSIVGLQSGRALGCEILIRSLGALVQSAETFSPPFFMEHLEQLTDKKIKAVKLVAQQPNQWVFINFSRCEVAHHLFKGCIKKLSKHLNKIQIVIEITECNADYNVEAFKHNIAKLRTSGFQTAIDDFGTGSSNVESLNIVKPDFVKLDISFIRKASSSELNAIKLYQLVDLIRHRGHKVVIEGVETKDELIIARKSRAEFAQGFYFHRPESIKADQYLTN